MFYFRRWRMSLLLAVCYLAFAVPAQAQTYWEIREHDLYGQALIVVVEGEITQTDSLSLSSAVESGADVSMRRVILSSDGGDLDAAMQMGRMLRKHDFNALIPKGHACMSACVFLLAAAVDKTVQGSVGIHRPYFVSGSPESIAGEIRELKALSAAFFREMNIPERLAEDMFSVDPGKVRILTSRELEDYRLSSKDFVAQEGDTLRTMNQLGMSRQAYERFRYDLNYSCRAFIGRPARMNECVSDVARRHGIPMEVSPNE
jgi:hypothetical protein